MGFLKAWIHLVWATKNRQPLLNRELRKKVFSHIKENALKKNIHVDFINGYLEHVHCLISLKADQSIAKVVQLLKGESAFWINQNNLCPHHFEWQGEYFAVSVSESQLNIVRNYIKNQEEHHSKKTFEQEYEEFMTKYGFNKMVG